MTAVAVAQGEKAPRSGHKLRALRHPASEFGVGPLAVTAWHPRLLVLAGACENVSLGGVCVRLHGAAERLDLVGVDDRFSGVHITLQSGEVIGHCDAIVRHCRSDGGDLLVGLQLEGGVIDLPLLYEKQTRSRFAARCDEAEATADSAKIRPEFKAWVLDLRNYLERMRTFLDREEGALQTEDQFTYEQICAQYLAEVGPRIVERVHAASHSMAQVVGSLREDEHIAHRAYAQLHLGSIFLSAPFIRRAHQKPLGYAGDYEMMNMLYRPSWEGSSLFAKVINQCAASEVAARANINRISYLAEKLRGPLVRARDAGGPRVRVASIGAGPGREIEVLLESDPSLGPYLDVMLLDQEPRAIAYGERRLAPIVARTGVQLCFVRESMRRLLCGGQVAQMIGERQIIYSAGLFDYLSDRSFAALLGTLYEALAGGGQLLIGNVDVSNPTRYFMEYFAEWFLIHRSRTQLLDKARLLRPPPQTVRVESEPLGVNLFLVIEK